MELVNELDDELRKFNEYKIPTNFFGQGVQYVEYFNSGGNTIDNGDNVDFKINLPKNESQE